ncbi:hypothetical protein [Spirillospora sp. NPDC029432]
MSTTLLLLVMAPLAVLLLLMLMERLESALLTPDRPKHARRERPNGS